MTRVVDPVGVFGLAQRRPGVGSVVDALAELEARPAPQLRIGGHVARPGHDVDPVHAQLQRLEVRHLDRVGGVGDGEAAVVEALVLGGDDAPAVEAAPVLVGRHVAVGGDRRAVGRHVVEMEVEHLGDAGADAHPLGDGVARVEVVQGVPGSEGIVLAGEDQLPGEVVRGVGVLAVQDVDQVLHRRLEPAVEGREGEAEARRRLGRDVVVELAPGEGAGSVEELEARIGAQTVHDQHLAEELARLLPEAGVPDRQVIVVLVAGADRGDAAERLHPLRRPVVAAHPEAEPDRVACRRAACSRTGSSCRRPSPSSSARTTLASAAAAAR